MWQLLLFLLVLVLGGVKMSQSKDGFMLVTSSYPETLTIKMDSSTHRPIRFQPPVCWTGLKSANQVLISPSLLQYGGQWKYSEATVRCVLSVCDSITSERPAVSAGTSSCQLRLPKRYSNQRRSPTQFSFLSHWRVTNRKTSLKYEIFKNNRMKKSRSRWFKEKNFNSL